MNCLQFGGLRVWPPLLLAPMAGLTHSALRRLLLSVGGVGLYSTEMLSARSLPGEDAATSPYLLRTPEETPLSYQLLLSSPDEVAPAVDVVEANGAQVIDLNLGCPAPLVRRRGGGSQLMEHPARARGLVAELRRRTQLPLSAKIRLGETLDAKLLQEFARMLEGQGVDLITVHARLRGEPYGRSPRWAWIGRVKQVVAVPVVGNGGILSVADAERCLSESGCDGLMLGRGAVIRPWLFRDLAAQLCGCPSTGSAVTRPELFRQFAGHLSEGFPPHRRLGRLKEFTAYFSQTYAFGHGLASSVQASVSFEQALERADQFFDRNETEQAPGGAG